MDSFYITLNSEPTSEFPKNTGNHFQKRIANNIQIDDGLWTAGMSSLFLPDAHQPSNPLDGIPDDAILITFQWHELTSTYEMQSRSFSFLKSHIGNSTKKVDIMQAVATAFEYSKMEKMKNKASTFKFPPRSAYNTDLTFRWEQNGDLILDNNSTSLGQMSPRISMNLLFAIQMGFILRSNDALSEIAHMNPKLGPNLKQTILKQDNGSDRYALDLENEWTIKRWGSRSRDSYWEIAPNKALYLSVASSWTFSFHDEIHPSQLIQIRSNLIQSTYFNDTMLNLLTQVLYKRENKGILHIEPTTIRYIPLRQPRVDIIEINLSDISGKAIALTTGTTSITLHFQRQNELLHHSTQFSTSRI